MSYERFAEMLLGASRDAILRRSRLAGVYKRTRLYAADASTAWPVPRLIWLAEARAIRYHTISKIYVSADGAEMRISRRATHDSLPAAASQRYASASSSSLPCVGVAALSAAAIDATFDYYAPIIMIAAPSALRAEHRADAGQARHA